MGFFIVLQDTKDGAVPVKVIGKAPNVDGKPNRKGNVEPFINIPPIIRLFIGNTLWGSPGVMPLPDESDSPIVWKLTLNPRTGNFNLHYPDRFETNQYGERKAIKEASGSLSMNGMGLLLADRLGADMAHSVIVMMAQTIYSAKLAA